MKEIKEIAQSFFLSQVLAFSFFFKLQFVEFLAYRYIINLKDLFYILDPVALNDKLNVGLKTGHYSI